MSWLKRLFGDRDRIREMQSRMPFPATGYFIDIGVLNDMRRNLIDRANQILASLKRRGNLSSIVVMEPYPGDWGQTPREHRESALLALMTQLENYEEEPKDHEVVLGGPEGKQKLSESVIFKEGQKEAYRLKQAMDQNKIRFLLGELTDRCKIITVLILE